MRSKKIAKNTIFALIEELVAIICGFVLPKYILMAFGSKYNGLITSITQFLSCAIILRSGIGGATRAALYKPLAQKNKDEVHSIIKATDLYMKKIGYILIIAIFIFSLIYPLLVKSEFKWFFSFSLFLIIGVSTFAESFFGITYLIVLQADQKLWIPSLMRSICYILNLTIAIILITIGSNIHIVKLGSALIYVLYPIILKYYVIKKYNIDSNVKPNKKSISQRWDAFWHQLATFTMSNTDVMVLTVFSNMLEVSVYSVYRLVSSGLERLILSFSSGLESAFGNMIAKNEKKALHDNLGVTEYIIYTLSTIIYTTALLLIIQFVSIYTKGVNDVNYLRPTFSYILMIAQFFNSIRIPYQIIVNAAGHYKQTKNGAIIEPIINITLSVILVIKYGLVGVAIGTLVATIFRTVQYSIYVSNNLVPRFILVIFKRIFLAILESVAVILIVNNIHLSDPSNYLSWIINAIIVFGISSFVVIILNSIFYKNDFKMAMKKFKTLLK